MTATDDPSQFYSGLIADLYQPLAGEIASADVYIPFLDQSGSPTLELACGSGVPLLDLVERGYDVDGLDASQDMLDRCHAAARERGIDISIHLAKMQSFSLPRRYRSIFLAGASFTLLCSDGDARDALACMFSHLEPGGSVLIPLEIPNVPANDQAIGRVREIRTDSGDRLRVSMVEFELSADGRDTRSRLRYERISPGGGKRHRGARLAQAMLVPGAVPGDAGDGWLRQDHVPAAPWRPSDAGCASLRCTGPSRASR